MLQSRKTFGLPRPSLVKANDCRGLEAKLCPANKLFFSLHCLWELETLKKRNYRNLNPSSTSRASFLGPQGRPAGKQKNTKKIKSN